MSEVRVTHSSVGAPPLPRAKYFSSTDFHDVVENTFGDIILSGLKIFPSSIPQSAPNHVYYHSLVVINQLVDNLIESKFS